MAIKNVVVLGSGSMGSGIAQVTAQGDMEVTLVDIEESALRAAKERIEKSAERIARGKFKDDEALRKKFVSNIFDRLKTSRDVDGSVAKADLVIEAVVENLKTKLDLFSRIDKVARPDTIFASNTSSLSITELASVTGRGHLFAGLHFFNPVPVMKLVEVVRTSDTSEETVALLLDYGKRLGKTAITCRDTPGFIVNRLLITVWAEGIRMMERGDATPRDIDTAMRLGAGFPMGPIELCDYVGMDIVKNVMDIWHERFPDNPMFEPIASLNKLVSEGKLGVKTSEGFYSYKK